MTAIHHPELDIVSGGFYPSEAGIDLAGERRIVTVAGRLPINYKHRASVVIEASRDDGQTWEYWHAIPRVPRAFEVSFNVNQPLRMRIAVGPVVEPFQVSISQS